MLILCLSYSITTVHNKWFILQFLIQFKGFLLRPNRAWKLETVFSRMTENVDSSNYKQVVDQNSYQPATEKNWTGIECSYPHDKNPASTLILDVTLDGRANFGVSGKEGCNRLGDLQWTQRLQATPLLQPSLVSGTQSYVIKSTP